MVELSDDDFDRSLQHCETWLQKLAEEPPIIDSILWSDESEYRLNGHVNKHNCCYWDNQNPGIQIPVSNDRRGLHVWCGISSGGLLSPYFFDGTVTGASYLTLLQQFAIEKACDAVPVEMCARAYRSVQSRFQDCVGVDGKQLPY